MQVLIHFKCWKPIYTLISAMIFELSQSGAIPVRSCKTTQNRLVFCSCINVLFFRGSTFCHSTVLYNWNKQSLYKPVYREGACETSNYRNSVRKFAKFPFTEPVKWKTPSSAKLLIECNWGRNNSIRDILKAYFY